MGTMFLHALVNLCSSDKSFYTHSSPALQLELNLVFYLFVFNLFCPASKQAELTWLFNRMAVFVPTNMHRKELESCRPISVWTKLTKILWLVANCYFTEYLGSFVISDVELWWLFFDVICVSASTSRLKP